jgi:hypothetical protein
MARWISLTLLFSLAGCRAVVGIEERSESSGWGGPQDTFGAACAPCVETRCELELRSCAADADCDRGARCLQGRADPASQQRCASSISDTAALRGVDLVECFERECADSCAPEMHWGCIGNYSWPEPSSDRATVRLQPLAYRPGFPPLAGVRVRACDRRSASCDDALAETRTDAEGTATLEVPLVKRKALGLGLDGFDGYFLLTEGGIVDNLRFTGMPVLYDTRLQQMVVLEPDALREGAKMASVEPDPERGHVVVEVRSCLLARPSGVRFEINVADGVGFYLNNGLVSASATETSQDGTGGFFNVAAGQNVIVTAVLADSGVEIGRTAFFVRPGAVSAITVIPSWKN